MNDCYVVVMGRRAGVSSDETRAQLLAAAMRVVAERGYDGTRVAEIAREAGVTTGAIYNHFDSKADLLTAAIREQGPGAFTDLIDAEPSLSAIEVFRRLGVQLPERSHLLSGPIMEIIVATRRDVDVAKPDPGIVQLALERAGVSASCAVFVGDSTWDALAARRAGVVTIGLRSGGVGTCELDCAGAAVIYDDPRDLLDHLEESPIAALTAPDSAPASH